MHLPPPTVLPFLSYFILLSPYLLKESYGWPSVQKSPSLVVRDDPPPPLESMPAASAEPWCAGLNLCPGQFNEGYATIKPGAGDRTVIGSPTSNNTQTGTYSCVAFPPSNWNPPMGFNPCEKDPSEFPYPKCSIDVPPASAGGDPTKPWITCTDGIINGTQSKDGSWAASQMADRGPEAFANASLPFIENATYWGNPNHRAPQGNFDPACMDVGYSPLGPDVCLYIACADWAPWLISSNMEWPYGHAKVTGGI